MTIQQKKELHTIEAELVTPKVTPWKGGVVATTADLIKVGDDLNAKVNDLAMYREVIRTGTPKVAELEYYKNKSKLKRFTPEWNALQNPIMKYYDDLKEGRSEIPGLETDITNLKAEYRQIEENIKDNEQAIIDTNVENKKVAKKYEDVFNEQNKNLYSVKQEPYESEEPYIKRIKQLDPMKYDPTLYENRAVTENSKEFMNNLKQVINDDAKISEITKQLGTKAIFDINKY